MVHRKLLMGWATFALSSVLFFNLGLVRVASGEKGKGYVPGEVLVKYVSAGGLATSEEPDLGRGTTTVRRFSRFGVRQVRLPSGMTVREARQVFSQDPRVAYVEPNYYRHVDAMPNDTFFGRLWGLHNTGQAVRGTAGSNDADVDGPEAWDIQTGDGAIVVAVLDTGLDWDHEDLAANIWANADEVENGADSDGNGFTDDVRGWDFVNDDNDPDDDNSGSFHGTHVAGTIGAVGDNGTGVVGVNWSVSLMPLKTLDFEGNGTVAEEILAIDYAVSNGAHVINASFSGEEYSQIEYDAISDAGDAGILFVAAAGNRGDGSFSSGWNNDGAGQAVYPASHDLDNIIAVAATDPDDLLADFSNYGPTSVDVAAPGVDIYSTEPGDAYQYKSGTSMATPHVSGLAALLVADGVGFAQLKDRVLNGVDVISSLSGDVLMAGRINAHSSLNPPAEPTAPAGLSVTVDSESAISLAWSDESGTESGFKIERKADGGVYAHVGSVGTDAEAYTDRGVLDGTGYSYRVRAFNAGGDSDPSNEAGGTTPLSSPTGLQAEATSTSRVELSWSDTSGTESGYEVERKTGASGTYRQIASVGANRVDWADTDLSASTTYTYRIRAYNGTGVSAYSGESTARTPEPSGGGGGGGCFVGVATRGF